MRCPITAIVTAYRRIPETLATLAKLQACVPAPDEILVHVDCGGDECRAAVTSAFPEIRVLVSDKPVGPGGARNKLIAAARNEIVASFDDDSYPMDQDYFARAASLLKANPRAAVLTGQVSLRGETPAAESEAVWPVASFQGCGCVYRREAFLAMRGYLPLRWAYGVEEADVALQLMDAGWTIMQVSSLRVFHDTQLQHHRSPQINADSIANIALLAYLRYPIRFWPLGALQLLNRVGYSLKTGRYRGIVKGLLAIPYTIVKYGPERQPIKPATLRHSRQLAKVRRKS